MDEGWFSEREAAAEQAAGAAVDLAACVREPIHLLGGIQSYGALIAVEADRLAVVSANAPELLGVPDLAGAPAERLLTIAQLDTLTALADADTGSTAMMPVELAAGRFDVTVHHSGSRLVLEFEPAQESKEFGAFYRPVRQALMRLQRAATVIEACRAAVTEIRAITGYERVVAYRFESADGPGEVIAEDVVEDWEPWLGLWFPAIDVPPQARRLYESNWIRVIADVDDVTARLVPPEPPLDLSMSVLRTVSAFHLEYLRNIDVRSSMSVSLLSDGRLWGLIACHGWDVTTLSAQVRAACEFFGVALSLHLAALREHDEAAARDRSRMMIARLLERTAVEPAGLTRIIECDTVVVRAGDRITVQGDDPGPSVVAALLAALPAADVGEPWHSDRLGEDLPELAGHAAVLAGALVLPTSAGGDRVIWVRRERTISRRWATDPAEPVRLGPHGRRLTPRGSAAVFLASVRGRSMPWSATDLAMAVELGRAIMGIATAADLDSFARDLREPLRGIALAATFIAEDADGLDPLTARRLESIQRLAGRMDELLNALLYYSRLGRTELRREPVGLRDAVRRALEVAGPRLAETDVEVELPPPEAVLDADPVLLDQLLVNLLVNAAQYARPEGPRTVAVGAGPAGTLFVRDNGIGIPEHLREQAFQLFHRLHPAMAGLEGTGAGLAIVRRIVERHGGRVWAGDSPGGGTTIWATFPPPGRLGR